MRIGGEKKRENNREKKGRNSDKEKERWRERETFVFNFSPLVFNQTLMGRAAGTRRLAVHNRI